MKIDIYRVPSGFDNVADSCSFDEPSGNWECVTIEIPGDFKFCENTMGETIIFDPDGRFCDPEYVRGKYSKKLGGLTPPHISFFASSPKPTSREIYPPFATYDFEIIG